jgi:hypothetical protein
MVVMREAQEQPTKVMLVVMVLLERVVAVAVVQVQ